MLNYFRRNSILFSPHRIGPMLIKNRFIRSPICIGAADKEGLPTKPEFDHIRALASGEVGLIIPGYVYPHKSGRCFFGQTGMISAEHANTWKDTIDFCHKKGSKIVFQIADGGAVCQPEAINGETPRGASPIGPNSREMTIAEIEELIEAYRKAAVRLERVGADGVMIHMAHGYGLSQFVSPAFNHRKDKYGGSMENNLRIVREIAQQIKKETSDSFAVICKLNGHDGVKGGVTPELAARYVKLLKHDGISLFEVSNGFQNRMVMSRARIHKQLPTNVHDITEKEYRDMLNSAVPGFEFQAGWALPYTRIIREMNPDVLTSTVGGNGNFAAMESILETQQTDFISMGRPLIREPDLVKKFLESKSQRAECVFCNLCFFGKKPVHCHFPKWTD